MWKVKDEHVEMGESLISFIFLSKMFKLLVILFVLMVLKINGIDTQIPSINKNIPLTSDIKVNRFCYSTVSISMTL